MLFCAGIGTSLLYWATIEWVYYYQAPPFGIAPESAEAADWAAMYGLFHWGPLAWALYCIPALPIAYAFHNRKIPFLQNQPGVPGRDRRSRGRPARQAHRCALHFRSCRRHRDLARSRHPDSLGVHQHADRNRADLCSRRLRDRHLDGHLRDHRLSRDGEGDQATRRRQRLSRVLPPRVRPGFRADGLHPRHLHQQSRTARDQLLQNELLHRPGGRVGLPADLDGLLLGVVDRLRAVHGALRGQDLAGQDHS